jgi:transposase
MGEGRYSSYEVRLRAVNAVSDGMPVGEVARAYGTHRTTVFRWVARYDEDGEDGLLRRPGSGRPRLLEELDERELRELVLKPASEFGYETDLWTVRRLHAVIEEEYQVAVSKDTIWRGLREAGLTYQKPEREYHEINEEARKEWLRKEVPKIRRTIKKYRAILYFQDESNISLTAFLGKTWAPRGKTPKQRVTGKRGGVAAMSAISRRGHLLFRLYGKRIASNEVIEFLRQMLRHHKRRHLVVVMDQAPPHVSKKTQAFINDQNRLHVFHLPSYSPDWNPDEKAWNHLKYQEIKSHQVKTKDELKALSRRKLKAMSKNAILMRGIFFRCCVADLFR